MRTFSKVLIGLCLSLAGCGGARSQESGTTPPPLVPQTEVPPARAGDPQGFARATNAFGLDVWRALRADGVIDGESSFAISPVSLSLALAMTYGGARGETADAMARVLHLASDPEQTMREAGALVRAWNDPERSAYELAIANRLFGAENVDFRAAYLDATREQFGAELQRLDFAHDADGARRTINTWVEQRTHERIRDLLPAGSVDASTRLVLANAVYFHGRWERAFDPAQTTDRAFFVGGRDEVRVPTMHAFGGRYGEDDGVQLLELPYAGDELAMLIVLPRARDGVAALEERLDEALVARWAERLGFDHRLEILLPRFRIETASLSLGRSLVQLGMGAAFSGSADFSGMIEPGQASVTISDVYHRVFVEVNEEGTEAAAASAVVIVPTAAGPRSEPARFVADHPFLFFLRDVRTGAILFAGRMSDPRA